MSKPNSAPKGPTQAPYEGQPQQAPHKEHNNHAHPKPSTPSKNNVVALPGMCLAEGCKKRSEKANFCMEHFDWFKEGLITKEGRKPTDFEKKHFDYTRRLAKRKAG